MFIKKLNSESEVIFQLEATQFKCVNLADTYDKYGQKIGHENAGDYSLHNSTSDAESNCVTEILKNFFEANADIDCDIKYDSDGWNFTCDEEISTELKLEIESFIGEWEEENATYEQVKAYTFWNGNNFQTIILEAEYSDDAITHEVVEDSQELEDAIEFKQEIEGGTFGLTFYKSKNGQFFIVKNQSSSFETYSIYEWDSYEAEVLRGELSAY